MKKQCFTQGGDHSEFHAGVLQIQHLGVDVRERRGDVLCDVPQAEAVAVHVAQRLGRRARDDGSLVLELLEEDWEVEGAEGGKFRGGPVASGDKLQTAARQQAVLASDFVPSSGYVFSPGQSEAAVPR